MKTQYMNNVPFLPGELTIVTSDHAELAMQHSARLADSFRRARLNGNNRGENTVLSM
ncbi:MAG TPA: hypothetical protein VEW28_08505 [Candidatus Kapabacteria bacterium]|nr:hypothetical protein [Candidatus Kapabacteria bacterium]